MTQNEMIYDYLKKKGSITTYEAFTELFITRLSARIFDIKKMYNLNIKEEWITKKIDMERLVVLKNIYWRRNRYEILFIL